MIRLNGIKDQLKDITAKATQGSLLRNGLNLVIIGEPNAGKSSLLNVLSGNNSAIVTDIAGTTRDVLHESINLDGMPLHLVDTAGLRESEDTVEKIGIDRAWKAVSKADIALLLLGESQLATKSDEIIQRLPESLPLIIVQNKIDLDKTDAGKRDDIIFISAKYKLGIDVLKDELKQLMGYKNNNEDIFIARRRHLRALENTQKLVNNCRNSIN